MRSPEKIIFSTKSIERMEQIFENKDLDISVRTMRKGDEILFYAKNVAVTLGYRNSREAVGDNVWNKNKVSLRELAMGNWQLPIRKYHPDTILVNEPGVYQLIFRSNLPSAGEFQQWVFECVLPSIRKTGSYELPEPKPLDGKQLKLLNETDLHYAVIRYIRIYHPDTLIIAGLG